MAIKRKKQAETAPELSTEERIKKAARKVFTQKGFKATRTRDIATEAGINLALLNYYFRSKEKLFEIVMLENLRQFVQGVFGIAHNEQTTWQQKVHGLVNYYIDMLLLQPDIPLFVMNEIRSNPEPLAKMIHANANLPGSVLLKQLQDGIQKGEIIPVNPLHLIANIMGLTVFPFISAPMLKTVVGINDKQFAEMMKERKELVPQWIIGMMTAKPTKKK